MKKLLLGTLLFAVVLAPAAFAEQTTYTEKFIQKHTQKIVDKEKQLQEKQKANQEAAAARQKARLDAIEKQKKEAAARQKAREDAAKARQDKIQKKKQLWNELISE